MENDWKEFFLGKNWKKNGEKKKSYLIIFFSENRGALFKTGVNRHPM